jgi:hypothetical protein
MPQRSKIAGDIWQFRKAIETQGAMMVRLTMIPKDVALSAAQPPTLVATAKSAQMVCAAFMVSPAQGQA